MIGIASVVAMVAIGQGARAAIAEQFSSLGTNLLNIRAVNPKAAKGISGGEVAKRLTLEDYSALLDIKKSSTLIKNVDAQVFGNVSIAAGANNAVTELVGAFSVIESMQANKPIAGRFFSESENDQRERVAVIGQSVARNLFGEEQNPIGASIKINRIDFTVIGLLPPKGSSSFKDRDDTVIVPLYTAMFRVLGRKTLTGLSIELYDQTDAEEVSSRITALLRQRHKLNNEHPDDFEIRNLNDIQQIYSQTTGVISSMLAAIAAVSLIVGGIGIMNVMLVAVKERTREVGLRKAIGAKRRDILSQFLVESAMIGLIGGIFGIILGFAASKIISQLIGWPSLISIPAIFIAFIFSLFVGVVFGLWPAKQASELSPIEALRYE